MTSPDSIVARLGEDVTLHRVTAAVYDDRDNFDEDASTIQSVTVKAIVSQPSERDLRQYQGRDVVPGLRITVPSSTDIDAARPGRPDRVTRGSITYEVDDVRRDRNPLTGTAKLTAMLVAIPGR